MDNDQAEMDNAHVMEVEMLRIMVPGNKRTVYMCM